MSQQTRFYEIDLMRFIAAAMVVLFHYTFVGYMLGYVDTLRFDGIGQYSRYFYLGINFFFIISGFVIFMSAAEGQVKRFIVSRVSRLYPAYIIVVLLTACVFLAFDQEKFSFTWQQLLLNLTMFQAAFGVANIESAYWTLWIELQFYAVILLLVCFNCLKYMVHVIALGLVMCTGLLFSPWHAEFNVWTNALPHWWGYFATGCLLYLVSRDGLCGYKLSLLVLALVFICKQNLMFADMMHTWYGVPFSKLVIVSANLLFFVGFCYSALTKNHPFRKAKYLSLGALTYPLYLIHQNIGYIIFNEFGTTANRYWLVLTTFVGMLVLAWLIAKFIEKPLAPRVKRVLLASS